jgi:hypothetical protein
LRFRHRCGDGFWGRRNLTGKLPDGCQDYPPVPKKDADVLKILIGQMADGCEVIPFSAGALPPFPFVFVLLVASSVEP